MEKSAPNRIPALKMALLGGGRRCLTLLQLLASDSFQWLDAEIVGVADLNSRAEGFQEALARGIYTTTDFKDLLSIEGLDLILDLTGEESVLAQLAEMKPPHVKLMDLTASRLFDDVSFFGQEVKKKTDDYWMSRSLAQALTKATSEGVMVLDRDYRIKTINEEACRRAGISEKEALGRFCFQVSHSSLTPCNSPNTPCPMEETLFSGKSAHALHEHSNAEGDSRFCDVSTYPLLDAKGEIIQVLEIFRDITPQLESQMERRAEALKHDLAYLVQEDKLISMGKLVASVAHEINNPIASLLNFSKLILRTIEEGPPSKEDLLRFEKWLALMVRETDRCGKIVGNLLSFSRQQSIEARRLQVKDILDQIFLLIGHQMQLSGVTLHSDFPAQLEIWGDPNQIQQCFLNLIFNALEAMPGGGDLDIRGDLEQKGRVVRLEISDTGTGIPSEVLPHIFEPFFTTKAKGQGVGLGLSMVYGIVQAHRGEIEAESRSGGGATFRLRFPSTASPLTKR
jgi:PAS domain S-box-containing protein